jgi:hypothetical protein
LSRSLRDHPFADPSADPGEDPESPGGTRVFSPPSDLGEGSSDPLAEPIAALLGAALALVTVMVPLLAVLTDPPPTLPRSGRVEAVSDSARPVRP